MKAKVFSSLFLVFALCTVNHSLAWSGDQNGDGDSQGQDGGDQEGPDNGDINGNESLHAKIILVATTNAPAGAKGCAKLEADDNNGTNTATLEIKTTGLDPGDYDISVVRKSDGSTVDLGLITITDCSQSGQTNEDNEMEDNSSNDGSGDQGDQGDNQDGDSQGGDQGGGCHCGGGTLQSVSQVDLPPDLDPMDIAQIIVSDTSGNPLLVGDLVDPTNGTQINFKACIHLSPDQGAPNCQGTAQVSTTANKGKLKSRFTMVASNVPANSTFDVHMNGHVVGKAKSNKKGKVLVKKLPANTLNLQSVQLKDSQGNTVANAKF
jgi:hypothetical protein